MKEKYKDLATFGLFLSGLVFIPFLSFSREQKERAIAERGNKCQRCGKSNMPLFAHHILPEQMGGADNMDNLFLVCGDCHPVLDKEAIRKGSLANGLKINEVLTDDPEIIGNMDKFNKALRRFTNRIIFNR
ncbi:MAG: hypothetical protein Fur009_7950 [Candidatus Microgenomates bacterium]